MCDNQKVAKYIVSFQQLSSKVNWGNADLHCQFYNGLPSRIKDEITRVGKLDNLNWLCTLIQSIDAHYWERHSRISRENAASSSKADKSDKFVKPNSESDNRKNNSGSNKGNSGSNNNNNNSGSSLNNSGQPPTSSSNSNKPDLSSKLGKDGKLTQ